MSIQDARSFGKAASDGDGGSLRLRTRTGSIAPAKQGSSQVLVRPVRATVKPGYEAHAATHGTWFTRLGGADAVVATLCTGGATHEPMSKQRQEGHAVGRMIRTVPDPPARFDPDAVCALPA